MELIIVALIVVLLLVVFGVINVRGRRGRGGI